MTDLSQALLVIDLQNGVCFNNGKIDHLDRLISQVNAKIEKYTAKNKPIIFVQHIDEDLVEGTHEWKIIPELKTEYGTNFVTKRHANSFFETSLQDVLIENKIQTFEICGAQTEYCIDATVKFAHGLGYTVLMEKGLTSTFDNPFMTAEKTIQFYEGIWQERFLLLD